MSQLLGNFNFLQVQLVPLTKAMEVDEAQGDHEQLSLESPLRDLCHASAVQQGSSR